MSKKICIASCSELIQSGFENSSETYASSGTDEKYLFRALEGFIIDYDIQDWKNIEKTRTWLDYNLILIRTTWDYSKSEKIARQFKNWLDQLIQDNVKVYNHPKIMKWNMHKSYLADLGKLGVPVIPTVSVLANSTLINATSVLQSIMEDMKWNDVILKPAIGGGSRACLRVIGSDSDAVIKGNEFLVSYTAARETKYDDVNVNDNVKDNDMDDDPCDMLVQPYLSSVEKHGEISVIVIDGVVSHLVQKRPINGDFRTQEEWGASINSLSKDHPLKRQAEYQALKILSLVKDCVEGVSDDNLLYARVDFLILKNSRNEGKQGIDGHVNEEKDNKNDVTNVVVDDDDDDDDDDSLVLLELELIEPCLFLSYSEKCPELIVQALLKRISN
jgi:glutathione synthase/RimK-type ligase-like ATP-grasp enzyme